ncbi:glycerate kinase type-2 family protein [Hoeflea prorocentri]|uniref:Glycerate kinase n=1 Tax=Hoeflea prorocentri TaxID=1922333 RepID=A0A9X3UHT5_9HYPH|nr:glycerate kinase [Hoeflea prorocentri]MCY6379443.1 glycerate kinase [Hoeflea prorocentri]MDA5397244.1 glycerate kinase [Hoeflea prorocentri]
MTAEPRSLLTSMFDAAIAAADPDLTIRAHLPRRQRGRTVVVGAGKGVAQLARALENHWDGPLEGVVVTRYGFGVDCRQIKVLEAAHPVPDEAGLDGATRLLEAVRGLGPDDLVIALICGGASALLPCPADGLSLNEEIEVNRALLASGAPISAMNAIRKQISKIKGGRLAAAAHPARVVSLIVSDIPGDNPADVGSGPTVADATTALDALGAVERYRIALPSRIISHIKDARSPAPAPEDPALQDHEHAVIASAGVSLEAAAKKAREMGLEAAILSDSIEGEARESAHVHAAMAREIVMRNRPFKKPIVLLSGGETTVTLRGEGKGGRNTEFLLSLALDIDGLAGIDALCADTDGIDGSEDNAGAFVNGDSVSDMRRAGLDPVALLADNDAWSAFHGINALFVPGPTGTNVNDFRAILVR